MKKRIGLLFALFLLMVLMMAAGCSKKQIAADESAIGTLDSYELARQQALSAEEEAARRRAIEEQRLLDEQQRQAMLKQQQQHFIAEDIYFDFDQSVIRSDAQEILRNKAEYLRENPGISVIIEGHCDDRGTAEYNLALGERRALAAKAFLMNLGISGSRLMTISYGEDALWIQEEQKKHMLKTEELISSSGNDQMVLKYNKKGLWEISWHF